MKTNSPIYCYITNREDKEIQEDPRKEAEKNSGKNTILSLSNIHSEFTLSLSLSLILYLVPQSQQDAFRGVREIYANDRVEIWGISAND
jgi:DNA topoisomerase VI subunit A